MFGWDQHPLGWGRGFTVHNVRSKIQTVQGVYRHSCSSIGTPLPTFAPNPGMVSKFLRNHLPLGGGLIDVRQNQSILRP